VGSLYTGGDTPPNMHKFYPAEMSVYTYKRPGWMKLAQQKPVNLAQRYRDDGYFS
jgi:hypothetical protein